MTIQSYSGKGKKKNHKYQCSECYRTWVNKSSATNHDCKGNPFESLSPNSKTPKKRRRGSSRGAKSFKSETWYPFENNQHLRTMADNGSIPKKDLSKLRRKDKQ